MVQDVFAGRLLVGAHVCRQHGAVLAVDLPLSLPVEMVGIYFANFTGFLIVERHQIRKVDV